MPALKSVLVHAAQHLHCVCDGFVQISELFLLVQDLDSIRRALDGSAHKIEVIYVLLTCSTEYYCT